MTLDETMAETDDGEDDELLLDSAEMADGGRRPSETAELPPTGTRSWLTRDETPAEPEAEAGARRRHPVRAHVEHRPRRAPRRRSARRTEEETPRMRAGTRDPLDIPRFLNRQNNQ